MPIDLTTPGEKWPGWYLIGRYESDVGAWLLHSGGECLLLEVPEGLRLEDVERAMEQIPKSRLRYATASHNHPDHFDEGMWKRLQQAYQMETAFLAPSAIRPRVAASTECNLRGEPLWLIQTPKHSPSDQVVVFRGVAMTGDLELGTLDSVSDGWPRAERVRLATKIESFRRLREFPRVYAYEVHATVSAHLNDVREGLDQAAWEALFPNRFSEVEVRAGRWVV